MASFRSEAEAFSGMSGMVEGHARHATGLKPRALARGVGSLTEGEIRVEVIKDDPEDNKFLSCALEGEADYIVTGDAHLKRLREYKGVKIITPRSFIDKIKTDR
jgi:rRNA-processing protein FCF1